MRARSFAGLAVLSLVGTSPALVLASPATAFAAPITCHGATATIVGTSGDDTLIGTAGRDVIVGLAGDDLIRGLGGNDVICGNVGSDVLDGGRGDDRLYGGTGLGNGHHNDDGDLLYAGDLLVGGPGDDYLDVGYDKDPRSDGYSWETISFGLSKHGVDVDLSAGTARGQGHDQVVDLRLQVVGTSHDDTVRAGKHGLGFYGGAGDDTVRGSKHADELSPGGGMDFAYRGAPAKIGVGGHDAAYGRGGKDNVSTAGGGGRDTLRGGKGADRLFYAGPAAVDVNAGPGADDVYVALPDRQGSLVSVGPSPEDGDELTLKVPKGTGVDWDMSTGTFLMNGEDREVQVSATPQVTLDGANSHWRIFGTDLPEQVMAFAGVAEFHGLGGDDSFYGSGGDDTFDGGAGEDTYEGDNGGTNTCVSVEHDKHDACST